MVTIITGRQNSQSILEFVLPINYSNRFVLVEKLQIAKKASDLIERCFLFSEVLRF